MERVSAALFIASPDAEEYRALIARELREHSEIAVATRPEEVPGAYRDQPVVLGRPDYLLPLLDRAPPIDWIQSTWAGVTPLVRHPFRAYRLTGLKEVFGEDMADFVTGHVLAFELRLRQRLESHRARRWDNRLNGRLRDRTVGIMGTGSIGRVVASRLALSGSSVIGFNASGRPVAGFEQIYSGETLHQFLSRCDYLIGLLPDTAATAGLLDAAALAALHPDAVLINAGRGSLIDEAALCGALESGHLAGVVLDVCDEEPPAHDSPLWEAPRLLLTGHTAAISQPADITSLFLDNYQRYLAGEALRYQIDFDKGY